MSSTPTLCYTRSRWMNVHLGESVEPSFTHLCMPHHMTDGVLNTPNKLCPALISLVFLHTFLALHSCARNHATWFSMFSMNFLKEVKINQFSCFSLPMICANVLHQCASFNPRTSPAEVMAQTLAYHQALKRKVNFFDLLQTQIQKGKFFKTLRRQNSAVLRRAALSGP